MKRLIYIVSIIGLVLMFVFTSTACSSGPSNDVIKDAVLQYTRDYSPYIGSNPYAGVTDVEVIRVGKPYKLSVLGQDVAYYPVQVYLISGNTKTEKEFTIFQGVYGDWIAE
jgi:hypothetical protein